MSLAKVSAPGLITFSILNAQLGLSGETKVLQKRGYGQAAIRNEHTASNPKIAHILQIITSILLIYHLTFFFSLVKIIVSIISEKKCCLIKLVRSCLCFVNLVLSLLFFFWRLAYSTSLEIKDLLPHSSS